MGNQLFIYTFATGRYQVYTDLWKFCIEHEYPEYSPVVFTTWGPPQVHGWPKYYGAVMRYLMEPPVQYYREGFQHFYITDVDMFILREEPTLFDFHMQRMTESGTCFSNARRGPGEPEGINRVTGLHFAHVSWYDATRVAREKYFLQLREGKIGQTSIDDELILAKIITESGLPLPPRRNLIAGHHGMHLGTVRDKRWVDVGERRVAFKARIRRSRAKRWAAITNTSEYKSIFNKINNIDRQAAWELRECEKFTKQMLNERTK